MGICRSLCAGTLTTQVKLQSKTTTRTGFGSETPTWSTYATVWAGRNDGTGREFLTSDQPRGDKKRVWIIRHRTDVTNSHRLVEVGSTGNVWDIVDVSDPSGARVDLFLQSVKRQP